MAMRDGAHYSNSHGGDFGSRRSASGGRGASQQSGKEPVGILKNNEHKADLKKKKPQLMRPESRLGDDQNDQEKKREVIKSNIRNPYMKKRIIKKQKLDPFDEEEQDREERLSIRNEEENMIDILLSGTTATLIIQTQKKIYIGWVGDSLVAL